jgi:O-antigen ligase
MHARTLPTALLLALAMAATTAPSLLAWNVSPSATFLNQALALLLWGLFVAATAARPAAAGLHGLRAAAPLLAALGLMAAAVGGSWALRGLPSTLALSALGLLAAAALVAAAGAQTGARNGAPDGKEGGKEDGKESEAAATHGRSAFAWLAWGLLLAALLNAGIAAVQVFAPGWADGSFIARSGLPGRAVGNLRQPNHLSSLLLWGCIGVVALLEARRLGQRWGWPLLALLVAAVVLTASRTGLVSVLLLALWGGLDRRLARGTRTLLLLAPLFYAAAWLGVDQWATATQHSFGGSARLAETDISSSRFAIWANTLQLIAQQPWAGVGWGNFNFAWSLTPLPGRPVAFFDHTHNLPLQLAVELGLPLATAALGLLLWALWRAARAAWAPAAGTLPAAGQGRLNVAARCALMLVLMTGLHSLLEYPLWYAYFLLPVAWCWGFALGAAAPATASASANAAESADGSRPTPRPAPRTAAPWLQPAAGLALALAAVLALADYSRVATIFRASPGAAPLAERIASGRHSLFFGHHADYAAVTSNVGLATPADQHAAFARATHYLLDTRLMLAWARARAAAGDEDGARHLAARLREFRNPGSKSFFEACAPGQDVSADPAVASATNAAAAAPPFQCQAPAQALAWPYFLKPPTPR